MLGGGDRRFFFLAAVRRYQFVWAHRRDPCVTEIQTEAPVVFRSNKSCTTVITGPLNAQKQNCGTWLPSAFIFSITVKMTSHSSQEFILKHGTDRPGCA
jgi:hypothetical protein